MKFLIFFYFCGSFLPSWIRIQIRIHNPGKTFVYMYSFLSLSTSFLLSVPLSPHDYCISAKQIWWMAQSSCQYVLLILLPVKCLSIWLPWSNPCSICEWSIPIHLGLIKGTLQWSGFWGFCVNWILIDPLHYLSCRSDFGFEVAVILVIDSPTRQVGESTRLPIDTIVVVVDNLKDTQKKCG